jgi:hypothetical protein
MWWRSLTWVSWRWASGLAGAPTIIDAWLFGFGSVAWMPVPMLVALAVPRLRDGLGLPISVPVMLAQNIPAIVLVGAVARDALTGGAVAEPVAASAAGLVLLAGVGHGLWMGRDRGAVAGLGVTFAGWCGALVVSGWLTPLNEAYYVMGALLLLGSDIVSTLSPDFREDTLIWPTLATAIFLVVFAGMPLIDGESIAQASAVLMTALVGLPIAWSIKRSARRQERSRCRVSA